MCILARGLGSWLLAETRPRTNSRRAAATTTTGAAAVVV